MFSRVKGLGMWRRWIVPAIIASLLATLSPGCGSSGPPKLPPAKDLEAKIDPALTKRKRAKGKGYDEISLRERKKLMREAAKQFEAQ